MPTKITLALQNLTQKRTQVREKFFGKKSVRTGYQRPNNTKELKKDQQVPVKSIEKQKQTQPRIPIFMSFLKKNLDLLSSY